MRFRNTYILAGIAILLIAYVILIEIRGREKAQIAEERAKKLFDFNEDAVRKITIKTSKGEIVLTKTGVDTWRLTAPLNTDADETTVRSLLTSIKNMERKREIDFNPGEETTYGFDNPQGEINVETEGSSFAFTVGSKSPVSYSLYIKKAGESKIILTGAGLDNHLRKGAEDFRDRKIMKFKRDEIESISITKSGRQTLIQRRNDGWWITIPETMKASEEEINRLLSTLDGLRVDKFVDDNPGSLRRYGLDKPKLSFSILLKDKGVLELSLGRIDEKDNGIYVRRGGSQGVYLVRKSILDDIGKGPEDLREKRLFSFKIGDVDRVEVQTGDEGILFKKNQKEEWEVNGERAKKYEVEDIVRKLRDLKANSFLGRKEIAKKRYGLDKPGVIVRVWNKGSDIPQELDIGAEKDKDVYACCSQDGWVVTIDRSVKELVSKSRENFIEKKQETDKEE